MADAILDRIVHQSHRIELSGKSLRDRHGNEEQATNHGAPTPQPAKTASPK